MAGLPTTTDAVTGQTGVLDTQYVIRSQGTTAQNMTPVPLAASGGSVANGVVDPRLPGNPKPGDARAGYLAAGMPEGNPSNDVAQAYGGANLLTVSRPAGTAGGGGIYPNITGAAPVGNPFTRSAWSVQNVDTFAEFAYAPFAAAHGTVQTINPVTLALVDGGAATWTVVVKEVNGVLTSTLPTGFTLTASTGVIALAATTVQGVTTIGLVATSNTGATAEADIVVTLS